jgi:predicted secreted protein
MPGVKESSSLHTRRIVGAIIAIFIILGVFGSIQLLRQSSVSRASAAAITPTGIPVYTLNLIQADNGKTFQVPSVGSLIIVSLKENLSTGYQWSNDTPTDILALINTRHVYPPGTPMPGAPSTGIFTFQANKLGTAQIQMKYWRTFEGPSSIIDRFTATIQVGPFLTPTTSPVSCKVTYTVSSQWNGGFVTNIVLTNTNSSASKGWTLQFTFPDSSQKVVQAWNTIWTQSGQLVTMKNTDSNGVIASGSSFNFGFVGSYVSANPPPTNMTCQLS